MSLHTSYIVGRQPILNGLEEVVGYELLFRSPQSISAAAVQCPLQASARVIVDILSGFGVSEIIGDKRGFINVDEELLMSDLLELLPAEQIGLELLEAIEPTPAVVARCIELKQRGFVLALDDHRYAPGFAPLYDGIVDIVKMDLIDTPLASLYDEVERLRRYPVKLLAEKVDSRHVYLRCRRMGFELFQGYFFARPTLMQKAKMASTGSSFFQLMQQLTNNAEIAAIEQTFKQSPALTYKLLLLVNSVGYAGRDKIRTVLQAVTRIGLDHLKRWVQLAIFADDGGQGTSHPLLEMAAVRAAFMEEMALLGLKETRLLRHAHPDECFMVGTLSMLMDIYEVDLRDILHQLNLSDDIQRALIAREGDMGTLLCLAEMLERLEFDEVADCLERMQVPSEQVLECQKKAYSWRSKLV